MTLQQREKLAEDVTKYLRREWKETFNKNDVVGIYNYCMDEATTNDAMTTAMEYEIKYG